MGKIYKPIFVYGEFALYASSDGYYKVMYINDGIKQNAFDTNCMVEAYRFMGQQCFNYVMLRCPSLYPDIDEMPNGKSKKDKNYNLEKIIKGDKNEK